MYQIGQNCSNKCCYFSGVNSFLTVLNNEAVIIKIENLKQRGKVASIMTCYFSTLYTKIPHSKLLKVLYDLTDFFLFYFIFFFDGDSHKYNSVL